METADMRRKPHAIELVRFKAAVCLSLSLVALAAFAPCLFDEVSASSNTSAAQRGAEAFDVKALLMEVAQKERSMLARRLEYTWTALQSERERDKRGEVKRERSSLYEVYPVRGEFVRKLLARDGVPVSREEAEKELRRAVERLERAAREEQKPSDVKPAPQAPSVEQTQNP